MHANNEIGNILPIEEVGELCKKYNAVFHSDTVQSMCHYPLDLQKIKVDFIVLYLKRNTQLILYYIILYFIFNTLY